MQMSFTKRLRISWQTLWQQSLGLFSRRKRVPHRLKLRLEPLEQRHLLATFVVDNTIDVHLNGQLNIREAITGATATVEDDVIELAPNSVHQLNSQLTIDVNSATNGNLTIQPSSGTATIDAGQHGRVVQILNGQVALKGLTIQNGLLDQVVFDPPNSMSGA